MPIELDIRRHSCDKPPYGLTDGGYRAFISNYIGLLSHPDKFMSGVCVGKYDSQSSQRKTLTDLGLSDAFIEITPMNDLVAPVISALEPIPVGHDAT